MKHFFKKIIPFLVIPVLVLVPVAIRAATNSYTYDTSNGDGWQKLNDSTWTRDLDGDGNADVTATKGEDKDGNQTWTYEFNVEDDSQNYYVYEKNLNGDIIDQSGYTPKGSDGKYAIEADPGKMDPGTHSYTITNSKEHEPSTEEKTGSLVIEKDLTGTLPNADTEATFTFKVTLKGLTNDAIYDGIPFVADNSNNISATVTLKAGADNRTARKEITGLPAEISMWEGQHAPVQYTVEEIPTSGYTLESKTGDTGTIEADQTQTAVFTNKSDYTEPPATGGFTISKQVKGSTAPEDASYTFHVHLDGLSAGKTYEYTVPVQKDGETVSYGSEKKTFAAKDDGTADVDLKLSKDGQSSFTGLPESAYYQITEDGGDYTSEYKASDAGSGASIVSKEGRNMEKNHTLSTQKETVDADENVRFAFTNTYVGVQSLSFKKYMVNADGNLAASDEEFEFTVSFSGLNEGDVITSPYGKFIADDYGEASKTFKVPADGSAITFEGIPADAEYSIEEKESNGYSAKYSTDTGEDTSKWNWTESPKISGTLKEGDKVSVTFANEKRTKIALPITGKRGFAFWIILAGSLVGVYYVQKTVRKKRKAHADSEEV